MSLPDDTDFELDLDRVYSPPPGVTPRPSKASQLPEKKVSKASDGGAAAAALGGSLAEFGNRFPRGDKSKMEGFRRKLHRPSALVAAGLAKEQVGSGPTGQLGMSAHQKLKNTDAVLEFQPNKAHKVLENVNRDEIFAPEPAHAAQLIKYLAIAMLLGTIGYLLWMYVDRMQIKRPDAADPGKESRVMTERIHQARIALDNYFWAVSPVDKARYVMDGEKLLPVMLKFYKEGGADPSVADSVATPLPPRQIGEDFWFTFEVTQRGTNIPVKIQVRESQDKRYLVDWLSFVDPGSMNWQDFLEERPTKPTQMRLLVKSTESYAPPYDAAEFLAYELHHAAGEAPILGYAKKSDRVAQKLVQQLKEKTEGVSLNLYLHFEPNALPQQARITEVSETWDSTDQ